MTKVERSDGLTQSERYLKELCDRAFLSLWSYPNLNKARGQELCDLLIVFDKRVIIFSDKSCQFPDTGDLELDWKRWFRRSITKSAEQVFGAERWIRERPERIFLDHACTKRFPLPIPSGEDIIFHRVVVALGAAERCRAHFGGSGSLMLSPLGGMHEVGDTMAFTVGDINPAKGFVHVFDDVTLDVVLRELDTVSDFASYLEAKERFIRSGSLLGAAGEEELLAIFLSRIEGSGHVLRLPAGATAMSVDEGHWADFIRSKEYASKREANGTSYVWDELIETFCRNISGDTLVEGRELGIEEHEKGVRIMAGEQRLARRMFGEAILDLFRSAAPDQRRTRVLLSPQRSEVGYVFMLEPRGTALESEYRIHRMRRLGDYVHVVRYLNPQLKHIVGVATEPLGSDGSSESMAYLDATEWRDEDEQRGRALHQMGLLKTTRRFEGSTQEYPVSPAAAGPPQATRNQRKKLRQDARKRSRR